MVAIPNPASVLGQKPLFNNPNMGTGFNDLLRQLNQLIIYDPAVVDITLGPQAIQQTAEAASNLITNSTPSLFRFFISPKTLDRDIRKIVVPVLEKKGWETIHFTETPTGMIPMSFSGTTGSLVPPQDLRDQGIWDTKYSINWLRFKQFEALVLNANGDLRMLFDGKLYEGYIEGLKYSESAESPFGVTYAFIFHAYPDRIQNISAPDTIFASVPVVSGALQTGAI